MDHIFLFLCMPCDLLLNIGHLGKKNSHLSQSLQTICTTQPIMKAYGPLKPFLGMFLSRPLHVLPNPPYMADFNVFISLKSLTPASFYNLKCFLVFYP